MREGGENCLKYLKRGWNRTYGRGNKDFKKGDQAGSRGECLKKGGAWTPLRTMVPNTRLKIVIVYSSFIEKMQTMYSIKVGLSPSIKKWFYLLQWKTFKNDKRCFLFYLKSYFHSQDIYFSVLTFWSCINDLVRTVMLISKFITSQPG